MEGRISIVRLIGSSLLAVLAVAGFIVAVFLYFAAWATGKEITGWVADIGTVAVVITASLTLAFGIGAAYAVWAMWLGRPIGRMVGLAVAIVTVLASGAVLLVGEVAESETLLYIAMGLGAVTAVAMIVPESVVASGEVPHPAER